MVHNKIYTYTKACYAASVLSSPSRDQLWVPLGFGSQDTSATSTERVSPNFFRAVGESRFGAFPDNCRLKIGELRGEDVGEKLKNVYGGFLLSTGEDRGKELPGSELSPKPSNGAPNTGEWDKGGTTASLSASMSSTSSFRSGEDRCEGTEQFPEISQQSPSHVSFLLMRIGVFCAVISPFLWYLLLSLRTDSLRGGGVRICIYSLLMKLPRRSRCR